MFGTQLEKELRAKLDRETKLRLRAQKVKLIILLQGFQLPL